LNPTFSSLPRWFACELTDVLPRVDSVSDDATSGTARHAFFQRVSDLVQTPFVPPCHGIEVKPGVWSGCSGGTDCPICAGQPLPARFYTLEEARELALADAADEHRGALAAIPLDSPAFRFGDVAAEVALALDLETGEARELGRGLERDYSSAKPTEIVGTIDRLGLIGDDGLYIGDYKGRSHRASPAKDPQFLAAALAASRIFRRSWAELEVIRIIGDDVFPAKERVDFVDLDAFEVRIHERRALAAGNVAAFKADGTLPEGEVGDHCRYCPSLRFCPAKMALARAALGGDSEEVQAIVKVGAAYITDESAPRLRQLVSDAEKVLEIVKEALRDYGRQTPFPLGDGSGRWYGVPPDATTRELLDGVKVRAVLAELFGEEAAAAGVKVEATLGGIESAAKAFLAANPALSKKGAIKENREKAEQLLQARGLLRTIAGGQVKVFKPKAEVARG
jgi:hypothetical protein